MIAARLALVFQILRWACGEVHKDFVDIDSIKSAIRLSSYFEDCYSNIQRFMLMESIEPQRKNCLTTYQPCFLPPKPSKQEKKSACPKGL